MSNTELVWVPAELAEKIKQVTDADKINIEIKRYIEETKKEISLEVHQMDEDVLKYRYQLISAKESFKKAKEEELSGFYDLWESFEKQKIDLEKKVSDISKQMSSINDQISRMNDLCSKTSYYSIEKIVDILERIEKLSDDSKNKLVGFIFGVNKND